MIRLQAYPEYVVPKSIPTISRSFNGAVSRIGPAIASVDEVGVYSAKCLLLLASFRLGTLRIGRLRFMMEIRIVKVQAMSPS